MWQDKASQKKNLLFLVLAGFFIANTLIAELIGTKIFSLEKTLSYAPLNFTFLSEENLSFNLSAGVIIWPIVFVFTDIINEYFGKKGVQTLTFLTTGLILYVFFILQWAIELAPAEFWITSHLNKHVNSSVLNLNEAFRLIYSQSNFIILGSICAFVISQLIDVAVFSRLHQILKGKYIWIRATGSTLVSQLIDSFVVLFIAFYIGAGWKISTIIAVGLVGYLYKFLVALLSTPLIYIAHYIIDWYLGVDLAKKIKTQALKR